MKNHPHPKRQPLPKGQKTGQRQARLETPQQLQRRLNKMTVPELLQEILQELRAR